MASLLADQATLADLSKKFDGRIPVRIHFLDNSSKVFLVKGNVQIKELVTMCLEKAGVQEIPVVTPYYALFESRNGSAIDGVLAMDTKVSEVLQSWNDANVSKTAKFLFMVRLFVPSIWGISQKDVVAHRLGRAKEDLPVAEYLRNSDVEDAASLQLQFVQAVYNIITGRYPTTAEQALTLGAIHFVLKFGRFKADKHKAGFLTNRIFEFIPVKHLKEGAGKKGQVNTAEWEDRLLTRVEELCRDELLNNSSTHTTRVTQSEQDEDGVGDQEEETAGSDLRFSLHDKAVTAQRRYLEIVFAMEPLFGGTFFKATQRAIRSLPETLFLCIHHEGLHLLDKAKQPLRSFYIEDIFRWGFKPNAMFYFEIAADNDLGTGSLEFDTTEGKVISDLLTDYALTFLKEREREEARALALGPIGLMKKKGGNSGFKPNPNLTKTEAAIRIQARYRGFALRNEWAREDAAILLQAVIRGYIARVRLSKIIAAMYQNGQL